MSGVDDLRFQMMGLGGPAGGGVAAAPSPQAGAKEGKSGSYPTFEACFLFFNPTCRRSSTPENAYWHPAES